MKETIYYKGVQIWKEGDKYTVPLNNFSLSFTTNGEVTDELLDACLDFLRKEEAGYEAKLNKLYAPLIEKYKEKGFDIKFWYDSGAKGIIEFFCRILYQDFYFGHGQFKAFEVQEIEQICNDALTSKETVF